MSELAEKDRRNYEITQKKDEVSEGNRRAVGGAENRCFLVIMSQQRELQLAK